MRLAHLAAMLALLAATAAVPAAANEIAVRQAALRATEDGLVLDAEFAFELTPRLAEAVSSGVPLYFQLEFELGRRRWYWFDERAATARLQQRLSYHPLSRQYRLSTGMLHQSFATLEEALQVLQRVRGWLVVERTTGFAEADYDAAVRLRLDTSLLPKPFQLSAFTSRDLQLEASWHRFTLPAPRQLPAPVEAREPRKAGER